MKKIVIFLILMHPCICQGAWNYTSGLITIPDANVLPHRHVLCGMTMSFCSTEPEVEENMIINFGLFDRCELGITMLTRDVFVGNVACRLLDAGNRRPAVAFGIYNVTTEKHVSVAGSGDNALPDVLEYRDKRTEERFSTFLVMTRELKWIGELTLGLGTGGFVGSGSRSQLLSVGDPKGSFQIGLIGGIRRTLPLGLEFVGDVNGRDVNCGVEWRYRWLRPVIGITQMEYLTRKEGYTRLILGLRIEYPERTALPPPERVAAAPVAPVDPGEDAEEEKLERLKEEIGQVESEFNAIESDGMLLDSELSALAPRPRAPETPKVKAAPQVKARPRFTVRFQPSQGAYLTSKNHASLEKIGEYLVLHGDVAAYITGHPDHSPLHSTGYSSREELSRTRARAVKLYLMARYDIAPERLVIVVGEDGKPGAKGRLESARKKEPRIEITLIQVTKDE